MHSTLLCIILFKKKFGRGFRKWRRERKEICISLRYMSKFFLTPYPKPHKQEMKRSLDMAPCPTHSFSDCFMGVCCKPGTGAREQKEQCLCSNGLTMQRVGDGGETKKKKENKIISDSGTIRDRIPECAGKTGYFSWGNLRSFLQRGDV